MTRNDFLTLVDSKEVDPKLWSVMKGEEEALDEEAFAIFLDKNKPGALLIDFANCYVLSHFDNETSKFVTYKFEKENIEEA